MNPFTGMFSPFPRLITSRLIMRRIQYSDLDDMYEYSENPDSCRFLTWDVHRSKADTKAYINQTLDNYRHNGERFALEWALESRDTGKMIGMCGFVRLDSLNVAGELGYVLNPTFWGNSIMPEAVSASLEYGFGRLKLHRICAQYISENEKSRRVMEKCGMKFEGISRQSRFIKGTYRDIGTCAILEDEYAELKSCGFYNRYM